MRLALAEHYGPTKPVALGGAFLIDKGKAKLHVMVSEELPRRNCTLHLPRFLFQAGLFESSSSDRQRRRRLASILRNEIAVGLPLRVYQSRSSNPACLHNYNLPLLLFQDLDLRLEHTHCFSDHGEGGHYHWDTTPEEVKYIGYFVPAQDVYRLGRPKSTHNVGRD